MSCEELRCYIPLRAVVTNPTRRRPLTVTVDGYPVGVGPRTAKLNAKEQARHG